MTVVRDRPHRLGASARVGWYLVALGPIVGGPHVASAQASTPSAGAASPTIACVDSSVSGIIGNTPCTIFARMTVRPFPTQQPLKWMLQRFPSRAAAERERGPTGAVVELDHVIWLLSVGPHHMTHKGEAVGVAEVGPLPLPPAASYEIIFAYVGVPSGARSAVHVQSGPEAWYVLSGAQCVETPTTVQHIAKGQSGLVPADTPLYLVATGSGMRRAFFVIVHDAARPFYTEINTWRPRGLCPRGAG